MSDKVDAFLSALAQLTVSGQALVDALSVKEAALVSSGRFLDPVIGSDSASGARLAPWQNLANIVGSTKPQAGETIWLRGGVYGNLMSSYFEHGVGGTPDAPITFRALPGEIVILNGYLAATQPNVIWRDVQFRYNEWTTRKSTQTGSAPSDLPNRYVRADASNVQFINCLFHDQRSPYMSSQSSGVLVYGCVSFNHGWSAPDRPHGHSFYVQNNPARQSIIEDCMFFDSYEYGLHAYAEDDELLGNVLIKGCTSFRNGSLGGTPKAGFLIGRGDVVPDGFTLDSNMTFGNSVGVQFYGLGASGVTLTNNVFPDGKSGPYSAIEETGNLYGPVGDRAIVRPNRFQPGRANVTLYNDSKASSVSVPSGLPAGTAYRLVNVQGGVDVNGVWRDLVYGTVAADGSITVDMRAGNHDVSHPVKGKAPATTFPLFGAFILEAVS